MTKKCIENTKNIFILGAKCAGTKPTEICRNWSGAVITDKSTGRHPIDGLSMASVDPRYDFNFI